MEDAIVKREVNRMVVSAMASTATIFRVRAARMERKPRRRIHFRLETFPIALTPVPQSVHPQCG